MFKIYVVHPDRFVCPITVVISGFKNHGGYFKGESFCVFPGPESECVFTEIRFEQKGFEGSPIELTEEFMLEEAFGQAKIDIAQYFQNAAQANKLMTLGSDYSFKEVDLAFLVHLRVRGDAEFLQKIHDFTDCKELIETIKPIFALPKITRTRMF